MCFLFKMMLRMRLKDKKTFFRVRHKIGYLEQDMNANSGILTWMYAKWHAWPAVKRVCTFDLGINKTRFDNSWGLCKIWSMMLIVHMIGNWYKQFGLKWNMGRSSKLSFSVDVQKAFWCLKGENILPNFAVMTWEDCKYDAQAGHEVKCGIWG